MIGVLLARKQALEIGFERVHAEAAVTSLSLVRSVTRTGTAKNWEATACLSLSTAKSDAGLRCGFADRVQVVDAVFICGLVLAQVVQELETDRDVA